MGINNKKNYLSRIRVSFSMLLFVMCLTLNVFFCGTYNLYELLNKTAVIEMRVSSESIADIGDGNNTTYFKAPLFNKTNFYDETITKNIGSLCMNTAIPKGISRLLFLIIIFLFSYLTLFILLPDRWTLINQKIRLDD